MSVRCSPLQSHETDKRRVCTKDPASSPCASCREEDEAAALVPARSPSGPLTDVSNSVRATSRGLSGELGLVEAPSKGLPRLQKQGSQPLSAAALEPGHLLLDVEQTAVSAASEVALGVRTAAVTSPVAVQLHSHGPARDRACSGAGLIPAGDGFEDLDLQENSRPRLSSIDDPGGAGDHIIVQQQQPSAATSVVPALESPSASDDTADSAGSCPSAAPSGDDVESDKGFSAELESLRFVAPSQQTDPPAACHQPLPSRFHLAYGYGEQMSMQQACAA